MKISVLYGTETGNAEMLAEDIQTALEDDHDVSCRNLADIDPAGLSGEEFLILVCSTYGEGDLPASAQPFAKRLDEGNFDLSAVRFAIFGLGDSEYEETFTHGSLKLSQRLQAQGAVQIGDRLTHDASQGEMPEDIAVPWAKAIVEGLPK